MRLVNWETELNSYIESENDKPFIWGKSDCCHFAIGAVEAVTGQKINTNETINNKKEAIEFLRNNGSVEDLADRYLNRKDVLYSSRGDIVSAIVDGQNIGLGVCMGDYMSFKTGTGLLRLNINSVLNAWSVE